MSFELNPVYAIYVLSALGLVLFVEAGYLLLHNSKSYRDRVNRRLRALGEQVDRESVLVQLRRERGLTASGDYAMSLQSLNRLIVQSGLTVGLGVLVALCAGGMAGVLLVTLALRGDLMEALIVAGLSGLIVPFGVLRYLRARRVKAFSMQFPDAIDVVVRSLRAGHPVPVAIGMVSREMPDPVGSEFGIAADEITYGSDLETAMRNLAFRVGQDDLPLFVTAVAIQSTTGGNLREILDNLSKIIRLRIKMRRKVTALSSEGRFSALFLSGLPILLFFIIQLVSPDFYGSVWDDPLTHTVLAITGGWMIAGNIVMFKMINFRI
jgi:tight adherence protein B